MQYFRITSYIELYKEKGAGQMLIVGAFGLTMLGIGLLEKAGLKINEGAVRLTATILQYGAILYILKMVSDKFL